MSELKNSNQPLLDINYQFIKNFPLPNSLQEEDRLSPWFWSLHTLLIECHIYRIFNQNDLKEFLFRLIINQNRINALHELEKLTDPLEFSFKNYIHQISVKDINDYYGIEIRDVLRNFAERNFFLDHLKAFAWRNYEENHNGETQPILTDELIATATAFADRVMEFVPAELFADQQRFVPKLEEIQGRIDAIARIPKFELEKIPLEVRNECMEIMFHDQWNKESIADAREYPEDFEDFYESERDYIYLAWLYANGLIGWDWGMASGVEGTDLDTFKYTMDDENGFPVGLEYVLRYRRVDHTWHLLEGLFFDEKEEVSDKNE